MTFGSKSIKISQKPQKIRKKLGKSGKKDRENWSEIRVFRGEVRFVSSGNEGNVHENGVKMMGKWTKKWSKMAKTR